jgi:hypothetical protein
MMGLLNDSPQRCYKLLKGIQGNMVHREGVDANADRHTQKRSRGHPDGMWAAQTQTWKIDAPASLWMISGQ